MPAAAVIPAPITYLKVAAVKKLVVDLRPGLTSDRRPSHLPGHFDRTERHTFSIIVISVI